MLSLSKSKFQLAVQLSKITTAALAFCLTTAHVAAAQTFTVEGNTHTTINQTVDGNTTTATLNVTGTSTLDDVTTDDLTVGGNLTTTYNTSTSSLNVSGSSTLGSTTTGSLSATTISASSLTTTGTVTGGTVTGWLCHVNLGSHKDL